jgi:uncharacterized protein YjcR
MQSAHLARRCGAKTRTGAPCRSPAVKGRRRCRMHGGKSSGAPKGNRNAWKHGRYTIAGRVERFKAKQTLRELQRLIILALASKPDIK